MRILRLNSQLSLALCVLLIILFCFFGGVVVVSVFTAGVVYALGMDIHTSLDKYMDFQEKSLYDENIKLEGYDSGTVWEKKKKRKHTEVNTTSNIVFIPGSPMTKASSFYYISYKFPKICSVVFLFFVFLFFFLLVTESILTPTFAEFRLIGPLNSCVFIWVPQKTRPEAQLLCYDFIGKLNPVKKD